MGFIGQVLSVTSDLRAMHEKRADARKFNDSFGGKLLLPSNDSTYKISLGYLERFLMKSEKKISDKGEENGVLIIEEWSEGCGYFEGEYKVENHKGEQIKRGTFQWEGAGSIEDTWDMFKIFS
jgi:hypothetical protein